MSAQNPAIPFRTNTTLLYIHAYIIYTIRNMCGQLILSKWPSDVVSWSATHVSAWAAQKVSFLFILLLRCLWYLLSVPNNNLSMPKKELSSVRLVINILRRIVYYADDHQVQTHVINGYAAVSHRTGAVGDMI